MCGGWEQPKHKGNKGVHALHGEHMLYDNADTATANTATANTATNPKA